MSTIDNRTWKLSPSGYGAAGDHPDGSQRLITVGSSDDDGPARRRELAVDLVHLANGLTRVERRTFESIRYLVTCGQEPTYRAISEDTGHGNATLAAAADRLEALGYITRRTNPAGRKFIELAPSWR